MIATWMLYLAVISAAFAVAAFAAERAFRAYRLPVRFVWLAAMVGTFALPVLTWLGWFSPASSLPVIGTGVESLVQTWAAAPGSAIPDPGSGGVVDVALIASWMLASVAVLVWIGISALRLRRDRAEWTLGVIDGETVFVSPDVGPAVVGFGAASVVVPEWLLRALPEAQRLALRHERFHVAAGDPYLLAIGLGAVILMPWNPVVWWMLSRLRGAIEVDCDGRVLKSGVSPDTYAALLLHISARRHLYPALSSAFAKSASLLGRRVTEMLPNRVHARGLRAVVYGVIALAFIAVGCDAPSPQSGSSTPVGLSDPGQPRLVVEGDEDLPNLVSPERLSCPAPSYPRLLREAGVEGQVLLRFIVDAAGGVESGSVEIISSTHTGFEAPATALIRECVFKPAELSGEIVRIEVMMPIVFALPRRDSVHVVLRGPATPRDSPLYVVDGVIVVERDLIDIDKLDIRRIEVVKGAAAEALYGARASNGVVQITTVNAADQQTVELVPVKERPELGN